MAVAYTCDECGKIGEDLAGWLYVSIQLGHEEPSAPIPPGRRMLDETMPDFHFDTVECRTKWLKAHELG
jgi:hypothetical protein